MNDRNHEPTLRVVHSAKKHRLANRLTLPSERRENARYGLLTVVLAAILLVLSAIVCWLVRP